MSKCCEPKKIQSEKFKKVVWIAFTLNFIMFFYEFGASFIANSKSLQADSLDFLGDAANYAVSLFVLNKAHATKAKASLLKAFTMGNLGVFISVGIAFNAINGVQPDSHLMTTLGLVALAVNALVAMLLYSFRDGDSNMQSVWLCSRNDAIGNLAVVGAGLSVQYFHTMWPDLLVAGFMAYLSISASYKIFKIASVELKNAKSTVTSLDQSQQHS